MFDTAYSDFKITRTPYGRDIAGQVAGATEQIRQIATATEELSATTQDMAHNLDGISSGVQSNSNATTELASTARSLASKAEALEEATGRFRTD